MSEQAKLEKELLDELEPNFKDNDQDLARKIDRGVRNAGSLFQTEFLNECKEADDFFDGRQVDHSKRRDYQSDTVLNRMFPITRNLVGFLTDNRPKGDVVPAKSDNPELQNANQDRASRVNDALDYHADYRLDLQGMLTKAGYDLLWKRDAWLMWYWDPTAGPYGDIGSEVIRPEDVYVVDPTPGSIQDKAVIYRPRKHRSWIKKHYPKKYAQVLAQGGETEQDEGFFRNLINRIRGGKDDKTDAYFRVDNYWSADNTWYCIKVGKVILEKGENKYWADEERQIKEAVERGELEPDENGDVAASIEETGWKAPATNYFDAPRKPFVRIPSYEKTDQFHSRNLFLQAKAAQRAYNKRSQQIEDNLNLMGNAQWRVDPSAMSRQQAENITNEAGLVIMAKEGEVEKLQPSQMPSDVFNDRETYANHIDLIFGQHDISRGASDRQQPVGTSQILQESDRTNIRLLSRNMEQAIEELYQGWVQLMKLFYTANHYVLKYGTDGAAMIQELNRNDIDDGINVLVKIGSGFPDQIDKRAEAFELWDKKATDPVTFFRDLEKPDAEERAQRLLNWQQQGILSDEDLTDRSQQSVQLADQENEQFANGEIPDPTPDELLSPEHLQKHMELLDSPDAESLPPEVRQALIQHVKDEEKRLEALTQQQ